MPFLTEENGFLFKQKAPPDLSTSQNFIVLGTKIMLCLTITHKICIYIFSKNTVSWTAAESFFEKRYFT